MRTEANLKQADVAVRLNRPQSFVAKYETGERRVDVVEFIEIAEAVGFDPVTFLADFLSDDPANDSRVQQPKAGLARPASPSDGQELGDGGHPRPGAAGRSGVDPSE